MTDGIKILERVLQQSSIRHGVLTSNIANVDTPNYRAKDVSFGSVLDNEVGLATTNAKHLPSPESGPPAEVKVDATQPWADKNNVEMDLEVAKMTQNAMLYQAGVTLLTKKVSMFKSALRTTG